MSAMKVHFQIAECSPLYQKKEGRVDFRKNLRFKEVLVGFRRSLKAQGSTGGFRKKQRASSPLANP